MQPKKTADQLIQDLLDGNLDLSHASPQEERLAQLSQQLDQSYDLSAETIQASLVKYKSQIHDAIGVELTDDQLVALSGGKGNHVQLTPVQILAIMLHAA